MSAITAVEGHTPYRKDVGVLPGKMGIWWFLASEIMIFGGLIGCYLLFRLESAGAWAAIGQNINQVFGTVNTLVLLTSSLTMVLAFAAIQDENRQKTKLYLALTVLLGLTFLVIKFFEYSGEVAHGFTPVTNLFWSFYYLMTGLHSLHVLAGIVANLVLFVMALKGTLWPEKSLRVEYAGLYWHFVDIVWIFLFPLLYLSY